jgi:hypothetical protein
VAPDAGQILLRAAYGWFERAERGMYRLTELGEAALRRWPVTTTAATVDPPEGLQPAGPAPCKRDWESRFGGMMGKVTCESPISQVVRHHREDTACRTHE